MKCSLPYQAWIFLAQYKELLVINFYGVDRLFSSKCAETAFAQRLLCASLLLQLGNEMLCGSMALCNY